MYFLIVIQKSDNGTAQTITAYNDKDTALAAFHSELAYAMTAKVLQWDLAEVITENGETVAFDKWYNHD